MNHPLIRADVERLMRPPSEVMRLARLGAMHPTRLSFLRILLRRLKKEGWRFDRPLWQIGPTGVGRAVYRAVGPDRTYSLVAFSHDLPPDRRTDRVIADVWDATFALVDGEPTAADLERLEANVPLQEAGRIGARELTLSRANRSVRFFDYVVDRLAIGLQPDESALHGNSYLMRTTAVYGSGKFGAADRDRIKDRAEFAPPFQAEMLTVWLIRQFTVDIVEHLARVRGGEQAVRLNPRIKGRLGVGNSTGLGMAPFIVRHPVLLHQWMHTRETALARVRAQPKAPPDAISGFEAAVRDTVRNLESWTSEHPIQVKKLACLKDFLDRLETKLRFMDWSAADPWDRLYRWAERDDVEGQELLVSLLLEANGTFVDDLENELSADEVSWRRIDGAITIRRTLTHLEANYDWALGLDFDDPAEAARFWYVSEEKAEPRIGDRTRDAGVEREQPLAIARLVQNYHRDLQSFDEGAPLATFLLSRPEHRLAARRVQVAARFPYAEIRDNLVGGEMLPIDMMRCKLAFFGAGRFDPRSDKWVRISLFQDMPYPLDPA